MEKGGGGYWSKWGNSALVKHPHEHHSNDKHWTGENRGCKPDFRNEDCKIVPIRTLLPTPYMSPTKAGGCLLLSIPCPEPSHLHAVEASEQAKFFIPATEVMIAQAAFCNILSPLQSARLIISIRMLYMSIPGLHFEAVDFLRFAATCLLDQELGAWLDDTLPPSWWPDS